jgi:Helix-loop-helix DNA-binding domain
VTRLPNKLSISNSQKIPVFEHGIYAPKKTAENCKVEGKVKFSSADKKRKERNTREQQRSCKISKQIDQLKELLHTSGFKVTLLKSFLLFRHFSPLLKQCIIRQYHIESFGWSPKGFLKLLLLFHEISFQMKKNSKSSVLAGVADYVKELQVLSLAFREFN